MKILVFDNYDSFTFNLVHYLEKISDAEVTVVRNDEIALNEIEKFDKIILSPGPGIPTEAGILIDVIKKYARSKSILGVCLGHQAIVEAFGGSLLNLETVFHGVATPIMVTEEDYLFKGLPKNFNVGRYHSWVADKSDFPDDLKITALDEYGNIMAMKHITLDIRGVQFHPESILTEYGLTLIENWVRKK